MAFEFSGILLLLYFALLYNSGYSDLILKQTECTNSKYWTCSVSRIIFNTSAEVDAEFVHRINSNDISNFSESGSVISGRIYETHVFYLNKVEPVSGALFISATLRWRFKPAYSSLRGHKHRFHVTIFANDSSQDLGTFQVDLTTADTAIAPKTQATCPLVLIRFDNSDKTDSYIHSLNQEENEGNKSGEILTFGKTYTFKVAEIAVNEGDHLLAAAVEKTVSFSSLLNSEEVSGCASAVNKSDALLSRNDGRRRRELASRWSTSIKQITFYPLHLLFNVSFYGAPYSHCIPRYAVELWLHDVVVHNRKFVNADDLVRVDGGALVGSVIFDSLERDTKYAIRVVPQERNANGNCVCEFGGKCGCVTIRSNLFTLNNLYDFNNKDEMITKQLPFANNPAEQREENSALYWIISILFVALTLFFLGLIFLLFVLKPSPNVRQKRKFFFVLDSHLKQTTNTAHKPLIYKSSAQTVLILNAEMRYQKEAQLLARLIGSVSNGRVNILYDRFNAEKIEENLQRWANHAVSTANKIILFHGRRASVIIGKNEAHIHASDRNIFDDTFRAAYANLIYTDPRIIHAKWDPAERTLFDHVEHIFVIPRDLNHALTLIGIPLSAHIEKQYQETFKEISAKSKTDVERNCAFLMDEECGQAAYVLPSAIAKYSLPISWASSSKTSIMSTMDLETKNECEERESLNEDDAYKPGLEKEENNHRALGVVQFEKINQTNEENLEGEDSGIYSGESTELCQPNARVLK